MFILWEEPKRNKSIGKSEWEIVKKQWKNRCAVCSKTEKSVGILHKAHIKARSKGGSQYIPLCPTCHYRYDHHQLNSTELSRIGLTKEQYKRVTPRKKKKETGFLW